MSPEGENVSWCWLEPSASMIHRLAACPFDERQKTIRWPLGDQAGSSSEAFELVSFVWCDPSASMTQMLPGPSVPVWRYHTILVPSADHRGRWSSGRAPVSRV